MEVSVNERSVITPPEEADTLGSLLDGLRARGEIGSDEVVVSLQVDDLPWKAEDVSRLHSTPLREGADVRVSTDDVRGCARRILTDAGSMLGVLQEAAGRVADQFRSGEPKEASTGLFNLLDALQRFLACLQHVKNTCSPGQSTADAPEQVTSRIMAALNSIQAHLEAEDWSSLAADLDSELLPSLAGFRQILRDIIEEI